MGRSDALPKRGEVPPESEVRALAQQLVSAERSVREIERSQAAWAEALTTARAVAKRCKDRLANCVGPERPARTFKVSERAVVLVVLDQQDDDLAHVSVEELE